MQKQVVYCANDQNGWVPAFFREIWKERYGQDPIENEICYEVHKNRAYLCMVGAIFTTLIGAIGLLMVPIVKTHVSILITCLMTIDLIATLIFWFQFQLLSKQSTDSNIWHFRKYVKSVHELFQLFDIEPSPEIGKMSREQFRQAVEETLMTKAHMMDPSIGFDGMTGRIKWKEMHHKVLFWDLCETGYEKYWPQKADSNPDIEPASKFDHKLDIERG